VSFLDISEFPFLYSACYFDNASISIQWSEVNACEDHEYILVKEINGDIDSSRNIGDNTNATISRTKTESGLFNLYGYFVQVQSNGRLCQTSDSVLKIPEDCKLTNVFSICGCHFVLSVG